MWVPCLLPPSAKSAPLLGAHIPSPKNSPFHNPGAWDELDLAPENCDVIFAYPWPGEESIVDSVFMRRACPDALLLTFHDFDRVLVQRKLADRPDPQILGWM